MNRQLVGRYELGNLIGNGGMGDVYLATDTQNGATVAVKSLKPSALENDPHVLERFRMEATALHQLNHPNIMRVLDQVEQDANHYIIMEYMEGGSLQDQIEQIYHVAHERFPIRFVIGCALEIADALTRAHYMKIIHRDLKPANLLFAGDGSIHLTDFGIAHFMNARRITDPNLLLGTLDYLSPESLQNPAADVRVDIWAFGVLLFEMLTGQVPFYGETTHNTVTAILTQPTPDLEEMRPDAPVALIDLVYRMLAKVPEQRISSARLVGVALEDIQIHLDQTTSTTGTEPLDNSLLTLHSATVIHRVAGDRHLPTPAPDTMLRNNLPNPLMPLIGREAELDALSNLLTLPDTRLVTLLAPGGMGKTRLALEVARQFAVEPLSQARFVDGVFWIELASLATTESLSSVLGEALRLDKQPGDADMRQVIISAISRKQALIVLDNFEHLIENAVWIGDLLAGAPNVKILATSRERLDLQGERLSRLEGLNFEAAGTTEQALEFSAVRLFVQSARNIQPGFTLKQDDLAPLVSILRQIDGLPLGIVLSAGWVELLSLTEIEGEIAKTLDFLKSDSRNIPERQRSIRAVFNYSWALLAENHRTTYGKLSVFRGGFTREAAQMVAGADLRALNTLVNKSLLRRNPNSGRFEIHELLRQYAAEKCQQSGDASTVRDAHSQFYLEMMYEQRTRHVMNGAPDPLEAEMENVRLAWSHALDRKDFSAIRRAMGGVIASQKE